jgi:hypothetical protein
VLTFLFADLPSRRSTSAIGRVCHREERERVASGKREEGPLAAEGLEKGGRFAGGGRAPGDIHNQRQREGGGAGGAWHPNALLITLIYS